MENIDMNEIYEVTLEESASELTQGLVMGRRPEGWMTGFWPFK